MTATTNAATFPVSTVEAAKAPLPEVAARQAMASFLGSDRIQASAGERETLVAGVRAHPLIAAVHAAFDEHRPLALSPDVVWLTLVQGVAHHVNMNAEALRGQFVAHEGQALIEIIRDDFVMGSPDNAWPEVFASFSRAIHDHIGAWHPVIAADFSTTTPVARAASEIAVMDTVQAFFRYEVHTRCGIPAVTLEGTVADWRAIARRVQELRRLGLDFWVDALAPVLEEIVATAAGTVDRAFWESIYAWEGPQGSGSPAVSGWIRNFFPYLDNPQVKRVEELVANLGDTEEIRQRFAKDLAAPRLLRNPWLGGAGQRHEGPGRDDFPRLPSRAPFQWIYLGKAFPMALAGGLVGVSQDPESLCIRPAIGWAVMATEA